MSQASEDCYNFRLNRNLEKIKHLYLFSFELSPHPQSIYGSFPRYNEQPHMYLREIQASHSVGELRSQHLNVAVHRSHSNKLSVDVSKAQYHRLLLPCNIQQIAQGNQPVTLSEMNSMQTAIFWDHAWALSCAAQKSNFAPNTQDRVSVFLHSIYFRIYRT